MTIVTADKTWTWPPEVVELARRKGVEAYLDPLLEATCDLFPEARAIRVEAWRDPEILDLEAVAFEVELPMADPSQSWQLTSQWMEAFARICPKPQVLAFNTILIPVKP